MLRFCKHLTIINIQIMIMARSLIMFSYVLNITFVRIILHVVIIIITTSLLAPPSYTLV